MMMNENISVMLFEQEQEFTEPAVSFFSQQFIVIRTYANIFFHQYLPSHHQSQGFSTKTKNFSEAKVK